MQISIITLFPQIFEPLINASIIKRAKEKNKVKFKLVDLRDFGIGKHKTVDDRPFGGGAGMILRADVLSSAIKSVKKSKKATVILLDPKGETYKQETCEKFAKLDNIILVCGHYEGFDERIREQVDYEVSIGDYILSSGETAAMVLIDSIVRLVPGVLKKDEASQIESFTKIGGKRILEFPQYTRPRVFNMKKVPEVLLSGNFQDIERYRMDEAEKLTKKRRPDLK